MLRSDGALRLIAKNVLFKADYAAACGLGAESRVFLATFLDARGLIEKEEQVHYIKLFYDVFIHQLIHACKHPQRHNLFPCSIVCVNQVVAWEDTPEPVKHRSFLSVRSSARPLETLHGVEDQTVEEPVVACSFSREQFVLEVYAQDPDHPSRIYEF